MSTAQRVSVPRDRDAREAAAARREFVPATLVCGELSLGSAIVAEEWVEAHDLCGRNR